MVWNHCKNNKNIRINKKSQIVYRSQYKKNRDLQNICNIKFPQSAETCSVGFTEYYSYLVYNKATEYFGIQSLCSTFPIDELVISTPLVIVWDCSNIKHHICLSTKMYVISWDVPGLVFSHGIPVCSLHSIAEECRSASCHRRVCLDASYYVYISFHINVSLVICAECK